MSLKGPFATSRHGCFQRCLAFLVNIIQIVLDRSRNLNEADLDVLERAGAQSFKGLHAESLEGYDVLNSAIRELRIGINSKCVIRDGLSEQIEVLQKVLTRIEGHEMSF